MGALARVVGKRSLGFDHAEGEHCLNERDLNPPRLLPSRPLRFPLSPFFLSLLLPFFWSPCDLYNIDLSFLRVISSVFFLISVHSFIVTLSRGSRHERERVPGHSQHRDSDSVHRDLRIFKSIAKVREQRPISHPDSPYLRVQPNISYPRSPPVPETQTIEAFIVGELLFLSEICFAKSPLRPS
ncbi:hypothetical protein BDW62DRAFT_187927 [Aspergillus aurantiobrunneus]